ncbi:MAG: hypothetical protein JJ858_16695 [Rhizobiaceae bacterium]|nr:hypothetical protein [Rhizobiaceae bacterium]
MRFACTFSVIALFATSADRQRDWNLLKQTQTLASQQRSDFQLDQIITGSLRGSSVVHPVSKAQILRLANAKISSSRHYSQEQLGEKIQELHELGALEAKCFRTKAYPVKKTRAGDWQKINYPLVNQYIDAGSPDSLPMSREKIMADIWLVREAALQDEGTPQRFRTFGLYLLQVQDTLVNAHRYFGDDGFKWAQKLVRTKYDDELAEHISQIIPSKFYTHRLNQNMKLFSQSRSDFIPCSVRARILLMGEETSS